MNNIISVLSKIPNLTKELIKIAPNLHFKDISEQNKIQLSQSDIIIADFDLLVENLAFIKTPKFIQGTFAGVENFLPHFTPEKFHSTIVSRFTGKHFGRLMSEYVITNIVNYERGFFDIYENKKQKLWSQQGKILQHRSLADLTIGILGVGTIGSKIAENLNIFGAKVWGFGRSEKISDKEKCKLYEQYCTKNSLPLLLTKCDYVVNVLPNTDDTTGLLNGNILQNCSNKETVFINIGRGNIISEEDLLTALKNKWLSAAILDVFEYEPLSMDSALWNCKQVFITPHVAGVSQAEHLAEQFVENLKLVQSGQTLLSQLLFNKKY